MNISAIFTNIIIKCVVILALPKSSKNGVVNEFLNLIGALIDSLWDEDLRKNVMSDIIEKVFNAKTMDIEMPAEK